MTDSAPPALGRVERILAYMAAAVIGVALIALIALLFAGASGLSGLDFAQGVWPVVGILPLVGFPIGMLLILSLLITAIVRRARGAQSGTAT